MRPASQLVIRAAEAGDIPGLCRLYFEFHEYHASRIPDRLVTLDDPGKQDTSELSAKLMDIIQGSDSRLFVAEAGGTCIGFAEVYVREDAVDPARVARRYAHLQSLLVDEKHRGRGIGTELLKAAEAWAGERGAVEMRLDTWEFSGDPTGFYERNGYRTLRRTLVRGLVS